MAKVKFSVVTIISLIALIVFCILFYVSVIGENNKANLAAKMLIEDIKNGNYSRLSKTYKSDINQNFSNLDDLIKYHFVLELTLLNHFKLQGKDDYDIKIERDNMWIPFTNNDDLGLSITLKDKIETTNIKGFFEKNEIEPLRNILVFTRVAGNWKLKDIEINSSPIYTDFTNFNENVELNKYVATSSDGFHLKDTAINTKKISLIEKRILRLNLKKALEILNQQ